VLDLYFRIKETATAIGPITPSPVMLIKCTQTDAAHYF
jgi:hypothetical protein